MMDQVLCGWEIKQNFIKLQSQCYILLYSREKSHLSTLLYTRENEKKGGWGRAIGRRVIEWGTKV